MKAVKGMIWVVAEWAACAFVPGLTPGLAQSPDIISFQGNGQLTWTNSGVDRFYTVQWAASPGGTSQWQSSYLSLTDIQSSNETVTVPVPMFYRVAAERNRIHFAAPVPRTGQEESYRPGDDGDGQPGIVWPVPRFTLRNDTNVVLDNLTGLMWTRSAHKGGSNNWDNAVDYCTTLEYGGFTDWRLPNRNELLSLFDYGQTNAALPALHPFEGVQAGFYWSSTTYASDAAYAWIVWAGSESAGTVSRSGKSGQYHVWPVRGGP